MSPLPSDKQLNFDGFESPHYTMVPDEVFDRLMSYLSGAELKVLLYIIRRTFGFKKDRDDISLSQITGGIVTREGKVLDKGTGLAKSTAVSALKSLVKKHIIIKQRNCSSEKGYEVTTYALNIREKSISPLPLSENQTRGSMKIEQALDRKSNIQETAIQERDFNNVNVTDKPKAEIDYLVSEILRICGDAQSTGFYRKVAAACPSSMVFQAISEVKDMKVSKELKKSPGAAFTWTIKELARNRNIEL